MLLMAHHISKAYSATVVFADLSLTLEANERVGLVGPNGVGKSTLLRLLAGHEELDAGSIMYGPSIQHGYLPQTTPDFYGSTMQDLILAAAGELRQLEEQMHEIETAMSSTNETELPHLLETYATISSQFQDRGGYDLEHKVETLLAGLGIADLPRTQEVATLSSGEKARLGLAMLLLAAPDLLLLDEPTNHLDFASLAWLESYLADYKGAVLLASHDRHFLNRTVTQIYELDEFDHQLHCYQGNYDAYVQAKAVRRKQWQLAYDLQQEKRKELQSTVRHTSHQEHFNRAPNDKGKYARYGSFQHVQHAVARNIRAMQQQLEQIEENLIPEPPEILPVRTTFSNDSLPSIREPVLTISHLSKYRDTRCLFQDLNLQIPASGRFLLTGPNGSGKTTLFKLILGREAPTEGSVALTSGIRTGYLAQEPEFPDPRQTVIKAFRADLTGFEQDFASELLDYGLFRSTELSRAVGQLSIGQLRKLEIALLLSRKPQFLLLDEPTNYLSLDVLEAFEHALQAFPGPILAISHDRHFIEHFQGVVWELADGRLRSIRQVW